MKKEDCYVSIEKLVDELFEKPNIFEIDIDNYSEKIKRLIITAFHIHWNDKED
jgi:hypothetical protein